MNSLAKKALSIQCTSFKPKRITTSLRANDSTPHAQPIQLKNGRPVSGMDLSVVSDGRSFPNPFVIGSGPPGTNYSVMKRALREGWGGVVTKTLTLNDEEEPIRNVNPRYAQFQSNGNPEILGWENIELTSDRPLPTMLDELRRLRDDYPDRRIIGSIMEKCDRARLEEIIERVEATGVDGLEINFSCPHGLPERGMGMAMGQDPEVLAKVCQWIKNKSTVPVWAKMTPNITDISVPAKAALENGCDGITAINTITSVMGVNLDTLRPEPSVQGYTTLGGYSYKVVKPIALAHVQKCAKLIYEEFNNDKSLSGIGGIDTGFDAAEFLLLGSTTIQLCTGVMVHGYAHIHKLCGELQAFMEKHNFTKISDFQGAALPYFTTHQHLVELHLEAKAKKKKVEQVNSDSDWSANKFSEEAQSMVSN